MKTNKKDIISILLGNTLLALAVILFIVPGHLLSGGTTGISLFLNHYFHLPISIFTFIFNFIVFIIGALILGKKFALQTLISTFYYPFILGVFEFSFQGFYLTDDILINTLFAGVLVGVAIAIVIKAGASTGGMDIPPLILNKLFKIPVSISMYVFDSLIVLAQFGFSDVRQCLYGIVLIFIYTMVIDKILVMGAQKIEVKIISSKYEEIRKAILTNVDRGVTMLHGQTGYLLENTEVLINVISTRELVQVERLVKSIDEDAFMIISNVHEVQGRGFNLEKEYIEKYGDQDVILAGSLFVYMPQESTYLFSGSYTEFNKFYAPAVLQEYMMLETIKRGIPKYNFLGIQGIFDGSDGVLRFKQNFNGYIVRKMGTFRYYPRPLKYKLISLIKKLLGRS